MTHTPGPWTIDFDNVVFGGALNTIICTVDVGDDYEPTVTGKGVQPAGQGRCDLRLIAAAPELLEALTRMADYVSGLDGGNGECFGIVRKARDAIAKATGLL